MSKTDIVTAIRQVEFFEITGVRNVSIKNVTDFITGLTSQRGTFEPSFFTFNNVAFHRRIPVIIRRIVVSKVTDIEPLLLVATKLRSKEAGTATALQGGNNHRENCDWHIGNIQNHGTSSDGLLRLHDHSPPIKVEVLVR